MTAARKDRHLMTIGDSTRAADSKDRKVRMSAVADFKAVG